MLANLISPAALGFVRVAVCSPALRVADVEFNVGVMIETMIEASAQDVRLVLFPELSITGYSCADLFYQSLLLENARAALRPLSETSVIYDVAAVVGLPLQVGGRLYNCAAFLAEGRIQGIVPKTYLPTTNEFYEERWFTSGLVADFDWVQIDGGDTPFGRDLLFTASNMPGCMFGVEICEDLWAVQPPSGDMAIAGATILLNLSASNELLGKVGYRSRPGAPAIGPLSGRLSVMPVRPGRIQHRHGLGRAFA